MSRRREHAVLQRLAYCTGVARADTVGRCVLCGADLVHHHDCPVRRAREILGGFDQPARVHTRQGVTPPS